MVNTNIVRAQIGGVIIFGVTAALYGAITLKDGRVEQANFDTHQMLRINEALAIEVHIVQSSEPPGGMGEPGTSAIVPAVGNAIFAATGNALRAPLQRAGVPLVSGGGAAPDHRCGPDEGGDVRTGRRSGQRPRGCRLPGEV